MLQDEAVLRYAGIVLGLLHHACTPACELCHLTIRIRARAKVLCEDLGRLLGERDKAVLLAAHVWGLLCACSLRLAPVDLAGASGRCCGSMATSWRLPWRFAGFPGRARVYGIAPSLLGRGSYSFQWLPWSHETVPAQRCMSMAELKEGVTSREEIVVKVRYRITCLLGAGAVLALGFAAGLITASPSRQGGQRVRTRIGRRDGYPGGGGCRAD
ncbi:hypothetical protein ACU4GD_40425 [Cupriavidus basilensis]